MTDQSKVEQELREEIARYIFWHLGGNEYYTTDQPIPLLPIEMSNRIYALTDQILAVIQEAGYVKLAEELELPINQLPNAREIADSYLKGAGLPTLLSYESAFFNGCVAQRYKDTEAGWRQVELEEK